MLFRMKYFTQQINEPLKTIKVIEKDFAIDIQKKIIESTPLWIYIVSIFGGILLLFLLIVAMYKFGFFKREIKNEVEPQNEETPRNEDEDFENQNFI